MTPGEKASCATCGRRTTIPARFATTQVLCRDCFDDARYRAETSQTSGIEDALSGMVSLGTQWSAKLVA